MSYIGKVDIGSDRYSVGSTLYGVCDTAANTAAKEATLADFVNLIRGVTIYIKFTSGNTATSGVTLKVGSTDALTVVGNCTCKANDIIAFTYEENQTSPGNCWRVHAGADSVTHSELNTAIASVPKAMIFRGALLALPDSSTSFSNYDNGDIVIVGHKEYIYSKGETAAGSTWIELGDESAYALESNQATLTVVNAWTGASVENGVLVLPSLTTTTANVIIPRA